MKATNHNRKYWKYKSLRSNSKHIKNQEAHESRPQSNSKINNWDHHPKEEVNRKELKK